ncbi:hypothetical protein M670_05006 [Schinkia azotoformans MEV2011]|uniref:Uncharacterized protein n=1 Tax=Schinkia azotoformans MEV2011 TaxID=1348973 RepID=A0A072NRJ8_SCHAZ|nr:hypothetical protein M670_05006 [Schinkia azotoformans MEV2011]
MKPPIRAIILLEKINDKDTLEKDTINAVTPKGNSLFLKNRK